MTRTIVTSILLAAAASLAPIAAHAGPPPDICEANPSETDCQYDVLTCRAAFAAEHAQVRRWGYVDEGTSNDVANCVRDLGLEKVCSSKGEVLGDIGPAGPDGVKAWVCYTPSPDQNAIEQLESIGAYIIAGIEQILPYVVDVAEAIDCLTGTIPTCIDVGRKIADLAFHDSTVDAAFGAASAVVGCFSEGDPTECAGLVGLAASATGLSTPIGALARAADGAQRCLDRDPGACLSLGVQAQKIAAKGTTLIVDPDLVADANEQLHRCDQGDLPSCLFLGADVANQSEISQQLDNLVNGASDAIDCLNGNPSACAKVAAHAAGQSALGSFSGALGDCVVNGTTEQCTKIAFDTAQAAGVGGGTLDDLSKLATEANGCTQGDVVGCASLGAHATDVLGLRGPIQNLDADASRTSRCGHVDPAACVGFGAEIVAREKAASRSPIVDTIHCRLRDADAPTDCASLGYAAVIASDQVVASSLAALCLAEGPPVTSSQVHTGFPQVSNIPPATPSLNAFGLATTISTGTSSIVSGTTAVAVSTTSSGPAGVNQVNPNYGHECELLGQALAGTATAAEYYSLTAQLNAGTTALTGQLDAAPATTSVSGTNSAVVPIVSTTGASTRTRAANLQ
jgi:hypothetical protein